MSDFNFWKNKKVLITGHTGFKGSWLTLFLKQLGANIYGISLEPKSNQDLFSSANINDLCKTYINDVRDVEKIKDIICDVRPEILIHMAAQPLVSVGYKDPIETITTNVIGTTSILNACLDIKELRVIINVTTDKVYDISSKIPFKESDMLGGEDPYSSSKACSELISYSFYKSYFENSKVSLLSARAGNVIGGGDYSKDRIIPDIYRSYKKKIIKLRNPSSVRPWQHVLEPLTGYLILAEKLYKNKIKGVTQNWNFGPNIGNCKSVKYISKRFAKYLKFKIAIKRDFFKNKKKTETDYLRLSNHKAKKYLKWFPKWSLNKSIDKIIEWNKYYNKSSYEGCVKQIKEFLE